jgi:hypothetical protein
VLPRGATDAITWELINDGEEMVDIKMTNTYNSELEEPLYYTYDTYIGLHGKHPQSRRPIAESARFYTARIPPSNAPTRSTSPKHSNNISNNIESSYNVNSNREFTGGKTRRKNKNRKHK